jgi:hypothetical protein
MFLDAEPLKLTPSPIATKCFLPSKPQLIPHLSTFNGDKNICQTGISSTL